MPVRARPCCLKKNRHQIDPPRQWGTQGLLRPIPRSALLYEPSLRIIDLAQPKHIADPAHRLIKSAKWDVDTANFSYKLSEELFQLSKPRHRCSTSTYSDSRPKSEPAKMPDIYRLSMPKTTALDEQINEAYQASLHEPKTKVFRPTSARIRELSKPITREATNNLPEDETFGVKSSALCCKSECNQYVASLAFPKRLPKEFLRPCNPMWKVQKGTLNATASERTKKLAESKNKDVNFKDAGDRQELENVYFGRHPNPFPVRKGALRAVCTRRVKKLARPMYGPDD